VLSGRERCPVPVQQRNCLAFVADKDIVPDEVRVAQHPGSFDVTCPFDDRFEPVDHVEHLVAPIENPGVVERLRSDSMLSV
jgi:hypothetical protein